MSEVMTEPRWDLPDQAYSTWRSRPEMSPPGEQWVIWFPNGYGASVVRGWWTYGGDQGLWELAVVSGHTPGIPDDPWNFQLEYDTPITDDVEGYLEPGDVSALLRQIAALPEKPEN